MGVMSAWLVVMLLYQLCVSFFGFKRNTKNYQDHDPQMRFLVLVPAHNEEAVIADIIDNLEHMEYPRELYDFYILADNCTDRTVEVARRMGANVLESHKESPDAPTGKPIVLQKALNALKGYQDHYDLVMFFDADNLVDPNMFLEVNSQYLSAEGKADIIQCYLGCKNRKGVVAMFYYMTYTITNRFFQYAKSRLGLNSVIGGTGFAVSAKYLYKRGGWTAMSLTEDFELQIEATCDGKGVKTFTCTVCNETKTEEIAALGHDFAYGYCSRCDLNANYNQKEWEQDIFEQTNGLRAKYNLGTLTYRDDLQYAADMRVEELVQNYVTYGDYGGKWGNPHVRPDGSGAATALGDKQDLACGENAANDAGIFGKGHMFYLWTQSEGHLAAIMNPDADGMVCALKEYNGRVFGIQIFVRDPDYNMDTQSAASDTSAPVEIAAVVVTDSATTETAAE